MRLDVSEIPTLEFDVGCHGSIQTDSTKVPVPIIIAAIVSSVVATKIADNLEQ